LGEKIAAALFGKKMANLAAGHSRGYSTIMEVPVSRLCAPDKLASTLVPKRLYLLMTTLTCEVFDYIEDIDESKPVYGGLVRETKREYRKRPELWYDAVVGLHGTMFCQALSLAKVPNALTSEPLEPSRRHPRSIATLLCDWLMAS
jgi:hypothetical protein